VLALQGDFREHLAVLGEIGVEPREVRLPGQLAGLDGLIIPGGESTTIAKLCDQYRLRSAIQEAAASGMAMMGTCAGLIVIAREVTDAEPRPFGLLDITVSRNWFGRQIDSFETDLDVDEIEGGVFRGVFIRAPAVVAVGAGVKTLAALADGTAVAVRSDRILGLSFHPELTGDIRLHEHFLSLASRS
jgi:5'-phosphate synthase pdxT subunit